ncbi:family 43 glycosylhydrolase [Paenibacillus sp. MDMC362]|uniref:family 43 glycosylhydrolase n=1 Tax=Paenibacillus sp. MDMC362 TaxID=2977365 RepID=UPI000DC4E37B|nr:family 43 glycosylhydrolase [Paenibacillus sp. MDMC362]RAR42351.1 hypothetical protein DP091_18930 [Paenibacillus sp. MDMC362]
MTMDIRKGDLGYGTYRNPVLAGDYADPSVLRVGNDYYMTHSSFTFAPRLLIWHSKDLVNWRPVGKALDRYIGDVWAPDFIVYEGTYYIYVPVDGKIVALTAPAPEGPWSEPVQLGLEAIDPGHVVDQEGNRYLHTGAGYMTKLSKDGLSIEGETVHVYDGWEFPDEWVVEEGIYGILRGWPAPCIPFNGKSVHMRMRNVEHKIIYYYSHDGSTWRKFPHSFEASGFHHNALGGYLALRIGLDACGEGKVMFKNFQYRTL